jgi:hypothetical protein
MTITFENENDVMIYGLEKVVSHTRRTQQIVVAQCVWWLASIIGLDRGLVNYIDNIQSRIEVSVISEEIPDNTAVTSEKQEEDRQVQILKECEEFLQDSRSLRGLAALKATGKTKTGQINPTPISKKALKKKDR